MLIKYKHLSLTYALQANVKLTHKVIRDIGIGTDLVCVQIRVASLGSCQFHIQFPLHKIVLISITNEISIFGI
jgi:hypothetical protein